jgi:hypothetical protein
MTKWTSAQNKTGIQLPFTFFVTSRFGARIINAQKGCGKNVATLNNEAIGSELKFNTSRYVFVAPEAAIKLPISSSGSILTAVVLVI